MRPSGPSKRTQSAFHIHTVHTSGIHQVYIDKSETRAEWDAAGGEKAADWMGSYHASIGFGDRDWSPDARVCAGQTPSS